MKDLVNTLGESASSYVIVRGWCHEFGCGRQSCEDELVATQENVKKVRDLVFQDT